MSLTISRYLRKSVIFFFQQVLNKRHVDDIFIDVQFEKILLTKKKQKKKMKDVSFMHAIMDTKGLKRKKNK